MTALRDLRSRHPVPDDHPRVVAAIETWWPNGRGVDLSAQVPRVFFQHFASTSWVVEDADGSLRGFLIAFRSGDDAESAYIHFVGVDPASRGRGVARSLYDCLFAELRAMGVRRVSAITGPGNLASQRFHTALGFSVGGAVEIDGVLAYPDYDGPGEHRVTLQRDL